VLKRAATWDALQKKMREHTDEEGFVEISLRVKGDGALSVMQIVQHLEGTGSAGHSHSVVIDPEGDSDDKRTVGWDGDGSDWIEDVKINGKEVQDSFLED